MAFLAQSLVLKPQIKLSVSSSVLLLTDLTISTKISDLTKMTFSNSIQLSFWDTRSYKFDFF